MEYSTIAITSLYCIILIDDEYFYDINDSMNI